jgi:hypothetical protein
MRPKTLARAAAAAAAGALLYRKFLRQPVLTWGASVEEAAARLPGDELLEDADGVATRAITIDAPRSAVWPWLGQLPLPLHSPVSEPLTRRLEAALAQLTRVRIQYRRLEHQHCEYRGLRTTSPGPPFLTEVGPRT